MKNVLEYLDKEGIAYTVDSNPSPETVERLNKIIEKREVLIKQMQDDFKSGKFNEIINS